MGTEDVVSDSGVAPAILAKSDNVRVVFRDTLKISLENEERNDYIYINNEMTKISQNDGVDIVLEKDVITIESSENSIVINRADGTINITSKSEVNVYTKTAYVEADDVKVNANDSVTVDCKTATVNATSKLDVTSPMSTFNGNMTVVGTVSCGPISAPSISTGGPSQFPPGPSTMAGPLTVADEVTGKGKNLSTHIHDLAAKVKVGPDVVPTLPPT
jgi:phage gp45-like